MKVHIGDAIASGLVCHGECTAANVVEAAQVRKLLHGQGDTVCCDNGADQHEERQEVEAWFLIAQKSAFVSH
jgi:IS5 family transposase